jgi:hypothetical protein
MQLEYMTLLVPALRLLQCCLGYSEQVRSSLQAAPRTDSAATTGASTGMLLFKEVRTCKQMQEQHRVYRIESILS